MGRNRASLFVVVVCLAASSGSPLFAGAHTWDVFEIFSNADGTIQFVELREMNGTSGEVGVGNGFLTSLTNSFDIPSNVASPTTNRHILFATAAFAALPGAPTPNFVIPAHFFSVSADTLSYTPYDSISFTSGQLPTDGTHSLNRSGSVLVVGVNSPENYAGVIGSIDASPGPPAVPDGRSGTVPMTVDRLDALGSSLSIGWDASTCTQASAHTVLYGGRSDLPSAPGGTFSVTGSVCGVGGSQLVWDPAPGTDSSGLLWWLIVAVDGTDEGSWGTDGAGLERLGPGTAFSSGQCGVTNRDTTNACGH